MPKKRLTKLPKILLLNTDYSSSRERIAARVHGGVAYYRLIKPMLGLEGYETIFKSGDMIEEAKDKSTVDFFDGLLKGYDAVVTKCIDNPEAASNLLFFAKKNGVKVILDLDDNMFEVKSDQPAYEAYKMGGEKRPIVAALLSMADGLFVSTKPLADYYTKFLKEVFNVEVPTFILPNYNDVKDFDFPMPKLDKDKIIIGWIGSTTHNNDLKLILPAMSRLLKEYPTLEFNIVAGLTEKATIELFTGFEHELLDRVFTSGGTVGWEGFPKLLMELHWDIGLAPLTNDEFNRGKSHIKWMEMAMKKIPCVASRVYPYHEKVLGQDTIIDGVTGMLADESEWYYKIRKLLRNAELRKEIGENAYKYVTENLQYDTHKKLWQDALSIILKTKKV